jgi:glutathione S-transferase
MMQLRYSSTSPFVRKVTVVALETGQDAEIERINTNPLDAELARHNPLQKVPALVLEDGSALIDSAVICEFLDVRKNGGLFPAGPERWQALNRMALCDGIMDAAVLRVMETRRPENLRSSDWDARQKKKIDQGLGLLEKEAPGLDERVDIGTLTAAIMLDYLDFRFRRENWRDAHPALVQWHKAFSVRPSLKATMPTE